MKRNCRIIFSLLLCMTLVFATFGMTSYAADTLDVVVKTDKASASAGEIITLTFGFDANPGITGCEASVEFDISKLEYVEDSAKIEQKLSDSNTFKKINGNTLKYTLWIMGDASDKTGVMASAQFKVKEGVAGKVDFTLTIGDSFTTVPLEEDTFDGVQDGSVGVAFSATSASVDIVTKVSEITLDKTDIKLDKGATEQLTATVSPADASDDSVSWISSNNQVATVDQSGKVTAVKPGTATITAKAGDKTATCKVTVSSPLKGISIEKEISLGVSATYTLKVTYNPDDTTSNKTVTWTSSNPTVAKVDKGVVTALANGEAIITAKCGEFSAECKVTVKDIPVTSVKLDKTSIELGKGATAVVKATLLPEDHTYNGNITWTSSNTAVATVSANGMITAVSGGNAIITAQVGTVKTTCSVRVIDIPAKSVTLDKTSFEIKAGERATLKATVSPSNSTDAVKFVSSNQNVAIVDNAGTVIAVGEGTAVITVIAGEKTTACTVTVSKSEEQTKITEVLISDKQLTLAVGEKYTLSYTVTPSGEIPKTFVWISNDYTVATVDDLGVVEAVAPGQTQITILIDASVYAECTLTVVETSDTTDGAQTDIPVTGEDTDVQTEDTTLPYGMGGGDTLPTDDIGTKDTGAIFKIILIIIIILILLFIAITIIYFVKKKNAYDYDDDDDDDYDFDDED